MDREALELRNKAMTEAFHTLPPKHYLRRAMLHFVARLPVARQKHRGKERILLIRPDHLGDMLLTTPAIRALRRARPRAEIHALAGPWGADVLSFYDELDAVLTLPFPGFSRSEKRSWRFPYELALRSARQLRLIGYSSVVIMRPDHWWGAMLAFLAGIPERIGYDHPDVSPFLTYALDMQNHHAVMQNLRLVERWTGRIAVDRVQYHFANDDEADRTYIDDFLQERGIAPDQPIFVIHPGSGTWAKQWDESAWATVADTLTDQLGAAAVFTGGDSERQLAQAISAQMKYPACIIAGETELGQLATLLKRAQVVLGPDSGPMHLAAAVGTPTVALFGPADPVTFGQWGSRDIHFVLTSDIGCRPCRVLDWDGDSPVYHPCVRDISVGRVLDAARRVVNHAIQ